MIIGEPVNESLFELKDDLSGIFEESSTKNKYLQQEVERLQMERGLSNMEQKRLAETLASRDQELNLLKLSHAKISIESQGYSEKLNLKEGEVAQLRIDLALLNSQLNSLKIEQAESALKLQNSSEMMNIKDQLLKQTQENYERLRLDQERLKKENEEALLKSRQSETEKQELLVVLQYLKETLRVKENMISDKRLTYEQAQTDLELNREQEVAFMEKQNSLLENKNNSLVQEVTNLR